MRERLPDYLFVERAQPDFIITGPVLPEVLIAYFERKFGKGTYRLRGYLKEDMRDLSRPEIPWHSFGPPSKDGSGPLAIIEAVSPRVESLHDLFRIRAYAVFSGSGRD